MQENDTIVQFDNDTSVDIRMENNMFEKQTILVGGFIESTEFENIAEIYDLIRGYNLKNGKLDDNFLAQKFD
jgi:hypothetical protein